MFGVATPGKLGTGSEITEHSEYFRIMVIKPYQDELLPTFNKLLSLKFEKPTTLDVKPLSLFMTGDIYENPAVVDKPVPSVEVENQEMQINQNIKAMSGREWQNMMRVVREYNKSKISYEQAAQMLRSAYGLSDEEITTWLGE